MSRPYLDRFAELVALVMKSPRTAAELSRLIGVKNTTVVYRQLEALKQEGVIYISGWKKNQCGGPHMAIYSWQPSVCEREDAAKPKVVKQRAISPSVSSMSAPLGRQYWCGIERATDRI